MLVYLKLANRIMKTKSWLAKITVTRRQGNFRIFSSQYSSTSPFEISGLREILQCSLLNASCITHLFAWMEGGGLTGLSAVACDGLFPFGWALPLKGNPGYTNHNSCHDKHDRRVLSRGPSFTRYNSRMGLFVLTYRMLSESQNSYLRSIPRCSNTSWKR